MVIIDLVACTLILSILIISFFLYYSLLKLLLLLNGVIKVVIAGMIIKTGAFIHYTNIGQN